MIDAAPEHGAIVVVAGTTASGKTALALELARALDGAPSLAELRGRVERDPGDMAARDLLGIRLLIGGDAVAGLDQFLHILKTQRDWQEGQAKKRLIAAFNVLDDADLVGTYRRKMSAVLF